jgi:ribosomal protein S18 acetylase RimI-like enzyme
VVPETDPAPESQPGFWLQPVGPDDWRSHREIRLEMLRDAPDAFWFTVADEVGLPESDWRARIERTWLVHARDVSGVLGSAGLGSHWEPDRSDTVTLFGMYVAPRGRGRRVGEALVRAVLEEARCRGCPEVILEVASNNAPAIALYERCGFVRTGMTHPHPRDETIHEVEMRAELGGSGASAPS